MADPVDWIERAEEAGKSLKEAITEGHQLLKDLKVARRELLHTKLDMHTEFAGMLKEVTAKIQAES